MYSIFPLQYKIRSPLSRHLLTLALVFAIFISGEIGRLFGLENLPLPISIVWPPTGISLATLMLFGNQACPGIFLGNFLNNLYNLYGDGGTIDPFIISGLISFGSLAQACIGGWIIRRYSSENYFSSLHDIFIFLFPGTIFSCLFSSLVGVSTLFIFGAIPTNDLATTMITFWLGDLFGVYIFTPLLIVWALQPTKAPLKSFIGEAFIMLIAFLLISSTTFIYNIATLHLMIPVAMWIAYRFRMWGATVAIFVISWTVMIFIAIGRGPEIGKTIDEQMIIFVSFLAVIVMISLTIAAIVNEREKAWQLLHKHNINLLQELNQQKRKFENIQSELYIKDKIASAGSLITHIIDQIITPINKIETEAKRALDRVSELQREAKGNKMLSQLDKNLRHIEKNRAFAKKIIDIVQSQTSRASPENIKVLSINLHTLLNSCLDEILSKYEHLSFNHSSVSVLREFDRNIPMISALPEDLSFALTHLLDNAFYSMYIKKSRLGAIYHPELMITTLDLENEIQVVIRDNGLGISKEALKNFFHSFSSSKKIAPDVGLGVFLVYEIIVNVHHGKIMASSIEGEFMELTLALPKSNHLKSA